MVAGTNSVPVQVPSLGCSKERNFTQCKASQLWYRMARSDVRQPWGRPHSRQTALPCSLLICSILCPSALACAALPHSALGRHLWCSASAREMLSSMGRESVLLEKSFQVSLRPITTFETKVWDFYNFIAITYQIITDFVVMFFFAFSSSNQCGNF